MKTVGGLRKTRHRGRSLVDIALQSPDSASQVTAIHYWNTNDRGRLGCIHHISTAQVIILPTFGRMLINRRTFQLDLITFQGTTLGQVQSKRRKVVIVEDDAELRLLMKMVLEDSEFDIIECQSAEMALATMLLEGRDVAMIFADIQLSGEMNGIDLAREVKMRWPHLVVILTSGRGAHLDELPPGVDYMPKPWKAVNVLTAAKRAQSTRGGR
jgi:CheY-like chemotaxis protein